MTITKFVESKSLSNLQIFKAIKESENELLKLKFKKISGQSSKSHQIKLQKSYIAQLKMILAERLTNLEKKQKNNLQNLLRK